MKNSKNIDVIKFFTNLFPDYGKYNEYYGKYTVHFRSCLRREGLCGKFHLSAVFRRFSVPAGRVGTGGRMVLYSGLSKKTEKKLKIILRIKKNEYLCSPVRETTGLAISRQAGFFNAKREKIIEKTVTGKYKQVPINKKSRALILLGIEASGFKLREFFLYKEEFDPGSG